MRQMKADEEERRDRAIRAKLAPHRAEHLIKTLHKKNDTGDSARNPSDAVYSNPLKGEQAMLHVSLSHDDLVVHPIWCDPNHCIPADPTMVDDRRLHQSIIGKVAATEGKDLDVTLVKFEDREPAVIVGDVELNADGIDNLVNLLFGARWDLTYAGGEA